MIVLYVLISIRDENVSKEKNKFINIITYHKTNMQLVNICIYWRIAYLPVSWIWRPHESSDMSRMHVSKAQYLNPRGSMFHNLKLSLCNSIGSIHKPKRCTNTINISNILHSLPFLARVFFSDQTELLIAFQWLRIFFQGNSEVKCIQNSFISARKTKNEREKERELLATYSRSG